MANRKKVLHIAHGIASYNNSLVEMARLFKGSGIELCVASHVDLSDVLQDCDATFVHLKVDEVIADERRQELEHTGRFHDPIRILRRILVNNRHRRRFLASRELDDLVEESQPDLLLIDMECHVAIIQLYGCGIKSVLCSRWFSVFRSGGVPPMHTRLQPSDNVIKTLKINVAWYRLWFKKIRLEFHSRFSRKRFWPISYLANSRLDLESVANERGISLRTITDRFHWLMPHVYSELAIMSLTVAELEFGEQFDHRMHYVGPLIGDKNSTPTRYSSATDHFERFLDRDDRNSDRKLIYCSFSTFWSTDRNNLEELVSVFTRCQDIDLVVGLGGNPIPKFISELPANILALEYAPQLRIMQCADVVITHGGISTINEALYHGVPLLVCSSGHVDQDGCLARVVHYGVGLATVGGTLNGIEIESLLKCLLSKEGQIVRDRVKVMQSIMRQYETKRSMLRFVERELSI